MNRPKNEIHGIVWCRKLFVILKLLSRCYTNHSQKFRNYEKLHFNLNFLISPIVVVIQKKYSHVHMYVYVSRSIESAVRIFRLIIGSPTYSWQLATLVALKILKILFKRCHTIPPSSHSPLFPVSSVSTSASHLTNHPTLSGSVFPFPQFPSTKCFCVIQNEFKCDRHWRHLCDNVKRWAYIEADIRHTI